MTRVLVMGDRFIPADSYVEALGDLDVRSVEWAADKLEQHRLQQVMEVNGANAVEPPPELLVAAAVTEFSGTGTASGAVNAAELGCT